MCKFCPYKDGDEFVSFPFAENLVETTSQKSIQLKGTRNRDL